VTAIRLYVDEDAAQQAVVDGLRSCGLDVQTVLDLQLEAMSDEEQLEYATANNRTIYTLNVGDFAKLHSEWLANDRQHAGIIAIPRQRYSIGEKVRRIVEFAQSTSGDEMMDRIEFL
jgi:hypothetical protein